MPQNVVSEPDIEVSVAHLRGLPHSAPTSMPVEWSRKRFLDTLKATLTANPKAKVVLPVAPGVWAMVQPFGVNLAGSTVERDERRQVWVLIHSAGTDPDRVEPLAV